MEIQEQVDLLAITLLGCRWYRYHDMRKADRRVLCNDTRWLKKDGYAPCDIGDPDEYAFPPIGPLVGIGGGRVRALDPANDDNHLMALFDVFMTKAKDDLPGDKWLELLGDIMEVIADVHGKERREAMIGMMCNWVDEEEINE